MREPAKAIEILDKLNDKSHPDHKTVMQLLNRWKKVASEKQKFFFKEVLPFVFENQQAEQLFREATDRGLNPLAMTTQRAVDESAENPTSPMKDVSPPPEGNQ